jgi:hypothetical protein
MGDETGTLVVGRIKGRPGKYIVLLVSIQKGHMLESSRELTEEKLRELLAENYGESETQVQARIDLANASPEI